MPGRNATQNLWDRIRGVARWVLAPRVTEEEEREAKNGITHAWSCLMKEMTFDLKKNTDKATTHSAGILEAIVDNDHPIIEYRIGCQVRPSYQLDTWPEGVFSEIKRYVEQVCLQYPHDDHEGQKAALLGGIDDVEKHIETKRLAGSSLLTDYDGEIGLTGNIIAIHQSLRIMNEIVPFQDDPAYPHMTETFGHALCLIDRDADGENLIGYLRKQTHYPPIKRACRAIQRHLDNVRSVLEDVDPGFRDSVLNPLEEAIAAGATHHPLKGGYLAAELRSVQEKIRFIGREIGALQTVHENLGRMI